MVNIGHLVRHSAMCFPERPAITWRGKTLDYQAFDARSAVFAEWLASVGAAPGERVVLYLDNCPDLLVAMFGAYRAGSTVLPSNARLTEQELAFLVTDGEAKVIVTDLAHAETARRAAGDARVVVVDRRALAAGRVRRGRPVAAGARPPGPPQRDRRGPHLTTDAPRRARRHSSPYFRSFWRSVDRWMPIRWAASALFPD